MVKFADIPYRRPDMAAAGTRIEALTGALRAAGSLAEAERLILEAEALGQEIFNDMALASIRYTQDTRDPFYSGEQAFFAGAAPALQEQITDFQRAMLESPLRPQLEERFPKVVFLNAEIAAQTISPQVLDLLEEEEKLALEYQQVVGSVMVEFDGQRLPMPKMAIYTQSPDRAVRRAALTAAGRALDEKAEAFDAIFDKMVALRTQIAAKLGFDNFIQLGYLRMNRNSYGPEEVGSFRRQVKRDLVPLVQALRRAQAERLGLDSLKFYDADVLRQKGNPRPIKTEEALYQVGVQMYRDMKPETAEMIDKMDQMATFDLFSREGKMSGGYCHYLPGPQVPFIFANFSGTAGDVEVFTHEGGHAFQAYTCRDHELASAVQPTFETCEVHSMGMEFMCWPYLDRFYGGQAEVAKVIHLIGALYFIPYGCLVDEFQHKIYADPQMSPEERNQAWADLEREYFPDMDYEDLPFYSAGRRWQRQQHIYTSPFYYIDYCLAQSCALQLLATLSEAGWEAAWEQYRAFVGMGGKLTFTQLLDRAGIKAPFADGALKGIVATAQRFIEAHTDIL